MRNYIVIFVCTGNICRSPMAEGILKDMLLDEFSNHRKVMPLEVLSAGTNAVNGAPVSSHALAVASEHGINLSFHRSRLLTAPVAAHADLILTMEKAHAEYIVSTLSVDTRTTELKTFLREPPLPASGRDIRDPIGMDIDVYRDVFGDIQTEVQRIAGALFDNAREKYRAD